MTRRAFIAGLTAVLAVSTSIAVWLAGPAPATPDSGRYLSATGPVPATEQRPGDPEAGYRALVNAPYVGCGMPFSAYARLNPDADPGDILAGREGRNAELPYNLTANETADGVEVVASNCLLCHAARFDGELVVGLGNEFLDFTGDPRDLVTSSGTYVRGAEESAAWQLWADRIEGIAPYTQMATVGVNPATNLTWALIAHRDPQTMAWSAEPLLEPPPTEPLPVSVPPWWRMSKKNAMFYTTIGRGDHARFMSLASLFCAESVEAVAAVDAYAPDIRAYIENLEAPEYPYPVDAGLADAGEEVFEATCGRCHGTYGEDESYPNLVIPLDVVGTDPEYALAATDGRRDRFYDWIMQSPYAQSVTTEPAPGYIAPPLDGVWATAPYLHNGSVPDVATLLDSARRADFWRHEGEPRRYDPDLLGWSWERLEAGKSSAASQDERDRIYDTTIPGYGNGGHRFGDPLTGAERRAVIEYLKTL